MPKFRYAVILLPALPVYGSPPLAKDCSPLDCGGELDRVSDYRGQRLAINFWATCCLPLYRALTHRLQTPCPILYI